jgi:hypothetical protein
MLQDQVRFYLFIEIAIDLILVDEILISIRWNAGIHLINAV